MNALHPENLDFKEHPNWICLNSGQQQSVCPSCPWLCPLPLHQRLATAAMSQGWDRSGRERGQPSFPWLLCPASLSSASSSSSASWCTGGEFCCTYVKVSWTMSSVFPHRPSLTSSFSQRRLFWPYFYCSWECFKLAGFQIWSEQHFMAKVPNFHQTVSRSFQTSQILLVLNSSPCSCKTQAAIIPRLMNTTLRVVSLTVSNIRRHVSIL